MTNRRVRLAQAVAGLSLTASAALLARGLWADRKLRSLRAPPSTRYAAANEALAPKGERPRIVLLGDSRISRWPVAALTPLGEILNRGVGGETAAQLEQRLTVDALGLDPDLLVLESGINDIIALAVAGDAGPAIAIQLSRRLQAIAVRARASGARVLLGTIAPPGQPEPWRRLLWPRSIPSIVAEVNARLRSWTPPQGVSLFDVVEILTGSTDQRLASRYRSDALHLNDAAYQALSRALAAQAPRSPASA